MSDEAKFTQADLDAAIAKSEEGLKAKVSEALDEVKMLKGKLRAASEITPDEMAKVEAERDKAQADLAEAQKQLKTITTERDKAVKALETEQGAARSYALEAEIASAIAAGNVVPALVPAFKAMVSQSAKADLVDGKYNVTIGDKAAKDYITAFLDSDEGKAFKAAPINSGGGAPGGKGAAGGKAVTTEQFNSMSPKERSAFFSDGGAIQDAA